MKNKPPIGVIGPNSLVDIPVISFVESKYKDPENKSIPTVKQIYAAKIKPFLARENVAKKSIVKTW